jgi:lipopolysaccharide/colanic/teichoic acid biosynthesis glycosyltransferase
MRRGFDLGFTLMLAALMSLPFLCVLVVHMVVMGRPFFHPSERMRSPAQSFVLWKLRSMRPARDNAGVSGGDKAARIPRWGRFLRASRLDEVPQLWNVLRGDMRLVGPRPPLREYVDRFPSLYAQVLQRPPGITGLATLVFHRHEKRLLANCTTAAETDAVYARRCIPRKARLDLIYHRRQRLLLDVVVLFWTVQALVRRRRHRLLRGRPMQFAPRLRHTAKSIPGPAS